MLMGRLVDYLRLLNRDPFVKNKKIKQEIIDVVSSKPHYERSDSPFEKWTSTLNKATVDFTYVPYVPKNISRTRLFDDNDLLSTEFSGCYMARYDYKGYRYGCHIATSTTKGCDRKDEWKSFIALNHFDKGIIFQPYVPTIIHNKSEKKLYCIGYPLKYGEYVKIWGIISNTNICYTAVIQFEKNDFFLLDIFETPSPDYRNPFFP